MRQSALHGPTGEDRLCVPRWFAFAATLYITGLVSALTAFAGSLILHSSHDGRLESLPQHLSTVPLMVWVVAITAGAGAGWTVATMVAPVLRRGRLLDLR